MFRPSLTFTFMQATMANFYADLDMKAAGGGRLPKK